jgi:lipid-binding SYLF domain-containing protein
MKLSSAGWLFLIAIHAVPIAPSRSEAASAAEINAEANATLHSFVRQTGGAKELANRAAGILVFPSVVKAGMGFGGEYGEGVLITHGQSAGYYNLISASFGFQLGVQVRSVIIMFMTNEALAGFDRAGAFAPVYGPELAQTMKGLLA